MTPQTEVRGEAASRLEVSTQAESAMQAVRLILGVMVVLLVAAVRPEGLVPDTGQTLAIGAAVIATVALLCWLGVLASRKPGFKIVSQVADVLATVAMVVLLDGPLGQLSWVLLIIPMVSATVRLGSLATLLTWIAGSGLFVGAALQGLIAELEPTALIRIPGLLLAVAISVSVLARWMREGWELQNDLTQQLLVREQRLATIEHTARSLHHLKADEAFKLCANSALELGFEAASVSAGVDLKIAVGDIDLIGATPSPKEGQPLTTVWVEEVGRLYSVAVREPRTDSVVVGWTRTAPSRDQADALSSLVVHTSTAIETSSLLDRLRVASRHDALTSLLNRRGLDETLAELASGLKFAAAFIDLDDLKSINDQNGHHAGDQAIVALARRLERAAGSSGIVARIGGDEFVVVVPDGDLTDVGEIGLAALDSLMQPVAFGQLVFQLGVSIGIAASEAPVDLSALLDRADQAVYQAKANGKHQLVAVTSEGTFHRLERTARPHPEGPVDEETGREFEGF